MKQVFKNGKLAIIFDETNPQDKLKIVKNKNEGKNKTDLTEKQKTELFDAYVDAGFITL